jgi:uncharacterized repeat protein (TIGR03803 family)
LILAGRAKAQIFTNLHSFTGSDGAGSVAGLIMEGDTLYGTAASGGSSGSGTVFKLNTDGTGFTNLYNFTGGSDGANPFSTLVLSNNRLYGTANTGGNGSPSHAASGTVFAVNSDGTGFTNLYRFTALSTGGTS